MLNLSLQLKLILLPLYWLCGIQIFFSVLSLFVFNDRVASPFFWPAFCLLLVAIIFQIRSSSLRLAHINMRDALAFAVSTWSLAGLVAALPLYFIVDLSYTDAVFEAISALTTTGATVIVGLDDLPPTLLLYRQFLQWVGGLGVVIFVVAILPMLNVGGMRLLRAETPGPIKDDKIAPRITSTSRYLWGIYCAITLMCAAAYWAAGMSVFDAFGHAFTTVSTGGFSTHDASMGYFNSNTLLWLANLFMLLGSISFALHFHLVHGKRALDYLRDEETRAFILSIVVFSLLMFAIIFHQVSYADNLTTLSQAVFHTISFMTSTGYGATDLSAWPSATIALLIIASYLGGCAGSTAGGNKVIRNVLTFKIIRQQLVKAIHPRAIVNVKLQGRAVPESLLTTVLTFMVLVAMTTIIFTFLLMLTGLPFLESFSAVSACINVLGPAFGSLSSNFIPVTDAGIWLLNLAMILGRLEYFTLLALLIPKFWRY